MSFKLIAGAFAAELRIALPNMLIWQVSDSWEDTVLWGQVAAAPYPGTSNGTIDPDNIVTVCSLFTCSSYRPNLTFKLCFIMTRLSASAYEITNHRRSENSFQYLAVSAHNIDYVFTGRSANNRLSNIWNEDTQYSETFALPEVGYRTEPCNSIRTLTPPSKTQLIVQKGLPFWRNGSSKELQQLN